MSALKPECDTIGQKEPSHKRGHPEKSPKRRPKESNEQNKHTLAQCSEAIPQAEKSHRLEEGIHQEKS